MKANQQLLSLAHVVLPTSILDWFEVVKIEDEYVPASGKEVFNGTLHIYLDEGDNRTSEMSEFRSNGYTEPTVVSDFPIRDRKVKLHIRRRRWLDKEGHNVLICGYPLAAEGTRISEEFANFLKGANEYASGDGEIDWFELGC